MTPWPSLVELAAAAVMVAGAWSVRATHPLASTGLAVATAGSLLPLWAASPWLPGPVRAGVLAAAPLTVAGVAQVALGWPTDVPPAALAAPGEPCTCSPAPPAWRTCSATTRSPTRDASGPARTSRPCSAAS